MCSIFVVNSCITDNEGNKLVLMGVLVGVVALLAATFVVIIVILFMYVHSPSE